MKRPKLLETGTKYTSIRWYISQLGFHAKILFEFGTAVLHPKVGLPKTNPMYYSRTSVAGASNI